MSRRSSIVSVGISFPRWGGEYSWRPWDASERYDNHRAPLTTSAPASITMAPTYNDQKQPQSLHHSPTPSVPPLSLFSSIDDAALVIVVEQRVSETSPEQRVCLAHLRTDACIRGAVRCKYAHTDWTLQEYGCLPSWRSGNHSPPLNKLSYRDLARASQPPVSAEMAIAARGAGSGQRSGSGSGSGWGSAKVEHRTGQKGGISLDVLARIRFIILDGTIIWDSDYREKVTTLVNRSGGVPSLPHEGSMPLLKCTTNHPLTHPSHQPIIKSPVQPLNSIQTGLLPLIKLWTTMVAVTATATAAVAVAVATGWVPMARSNRWHCTSYSASVF